MRRVSTPGGFTSLREFRRVTAQRQGQHPRIRDLSGYTPAQLERRAQILAPVLFTTIERKSWAGALVPHLDIPDLEGYFTPPMVLRTCDPEAGGFDTLEGD